MSGHYIVRLFPVCFLLLVCVLSALFLAVFRKNMRMAEQLRRRQQIGKLGEEDTLRQLEKIRGHKRILSNLYVPLPDGENTTEIDAVMVHEKGIFVVENKNYSGTIYGREEEYRWLQIQRQGRKKWTKHFYSPVRQNQTHIRHLKRFLSQKEETQPIPYISVITFNDGAKLRRIRIRSKEMMVSESRKIKKRLRRKMRWMPRVLTRKQVEEIYEALLPLENPGRRIRKQHARYLNYR